MFCRRNLFIVAMTIGLTGCGHQEEAAPPPPPPTPPAAPAPAPAPQPPAAAPQAQTAPDMPAPAENPEPAKSTPEPEASAAKAGATGTEKAGQTRAEGTTGALEEKIRTALAQPVPENVDSRLKQIGLAMHQLLDASDHRFPTIDMTKSAFAPSPLSWRVALLKYLDPTLYAQFKIDEPWDSAHNRPLVEKMPAVYGSDPEGKTRLQLIGGQGTPFQAGPGIQLQDVTDGTSATLMVVQAGPDRSEIWTKPGGLEFDSANPAATLGDVGDHFAAVMMDGSVRTIPVSAPYLPLLIQHRDGQALPTDFFGTTQAASVASAAGNTTSRPLPPLSSTPPEFDGKYIPADAMTVLTIQPRRILANPVVSRIITLATGKSDNDVESFLKSLPASEANPLTKLPIALTQLEQIQLIGRAIDGAGAASASDTSTPLARTSFVLLSSAAFPVEDLVVSFHGQNPSAELRNIGNVPYLTAGSDAPGLAFPAENTLVVTYDQDIEAILQAAQTSSPDVLSPLAASLKKLGNRMIMLSMDTTQPAFQQALQSPAITGPAQAVLPMISGIQNFRFALDFAAPELLQMAVTQPDPQVVNAIGDSLRGMISQVKLAASQLQPGAPANLTPEQITLLQQTADGTTLNIAGNEISLTIQRPAAFDTLPEAIAPQLAMARLAAQSGAGGMNFSLGGIVPEAPTPAKNIAQQMLAFNTEHGHFPSANGSGDEKERNRGLSWRVYLLPFSEDTALYEKFKLKEAWDSRDNKPLIAEMPTDYGTDSDDKSRYQVLVGRNSPFHSGPGIKLEEITDGASVTIMFIEAGEDKAEIWTKPGGLRYEVKNPVKSFGKADPETNSFTAAMMDGSVRQIPKDIDPVVLQRLIEHADGKPVEGF